MANKRTRKSEIKDKKIRLVVTETGSYNDGYSFIGHCRSLAPSENVKSVTQLM